MELREVTAMGQREDTTVEQRDDRQPERRDGASVERRDGASMESRGNASIAQRENTTVERHDGASVEQRENTTVEQRGGTSAEQRGGRPMGLRECMEYAVNSSVSVRERLTKIDDARLERRDAILQAFTPSVEGNAYGYYRWGRSIDPETNTYVTTTSFNNGLGVSAGITLFNGFSAINNIKIANTSLMMGQSAEQQERDKVCLATMEAYFNVVYYNSLTEIIAQQRDNAERALLLARRQEELGVKGYADVVQMEAELSDREYELVTARNSLQSAKITLEDVMFYPVDSVLTIDMSVASLGEFRVEGLECRGVESGEWRVGAGSEANSNATNAAGNAAGSEANSSAMSAAGNGVGNLASGCATSAAGNEAGSEAMSQTGSGANSNATNAAGNLASGCATGAAGSGVGNLANSSATSGAGSAAENAAMSQTGNQASNLATSAATPLAGYATSGEAEAIVARAKLYMPGVVQARGTLDNAARNLSTAKWQFLPKLGLYSGWSTSYYTYPGVAGYIATPYWDQFKNNSGEYLELSLTIPIYDRLAKHTKLAKMRNEYRRADDSYKKALRDVESEVRRALQDRDGALAAMRQADRRAASQQEAWKVNVKKYEQGLISGIEYNTAASSFLKAEAESLNAKLQYQLKRRIVDYYSGISYLDQK